MVSVKIGQLFALYVGASLHLHNLRCPCLTGNIDCARPRGSTGASLAFNDIRQGFVQTFQSRWLHADRANLFRPVLANHGTVHRFDFVNDPGSIESSAVCQCSHHIGELQRRHRKIALADSHRESLPGIPRLAEPLSFPFAVRNDACLLVIESSPAFLSQSEGPSPLGNFIYSDPLACLVEVGVTRFDNRPVQIHRTMPTFFPVPELTIAEVIVAPIRDSALWLQHTLF